MLLTGFGLIRAGASATRGGTRTRIQTLPEIGI